MNRHHRAFGGVWRVVIARADTVDHQQQLEELAVVYVFLAFVPRAENASEFDSQ